MNRWGVISDLFAMKKGDLIFLYVKKEKKLHGVFRTELTALYDPSEIESSSGKSILDKRYPYRFTFQPYAHEFLVPLELDDLADLIDRKKIWSFPHPITMERTRGARSVNPITHSEAMELIHLLLRENPVAATARQLTRPYIPSMVQKIQLTFNARSDGSLRYESNLAAWLNQELADRNPSISNIIGQYSEFISGIPAGEKRIDLLCIHRKEANQIHSGRPYLFTIFELMTGKGDMDHFGRLSFYRDWAVDKLAAGDRRAVQTVMVARDYRPEVIRSAEGTGKRSRFILLDYDVSGSPGKLTIEKRFP